MDKPISGIRKEYSLRGFTEAEADPDPLKQFDAWFDEAVRCGLSEPNAMALATAGADGRPAVRMVLLKGFDSRGFVFYTNYESRKGRELTANAHAAACFWWDDVERQVRIEGTVEPITAEESDAYFQTRGRECQLAAWASKQSTVIASRAVLEHRLRELAARHGDQAVPRPPNWGGYCLCPGVVEFWQGRQQRLHDRVCYRRGDDGSWIIERLSP